MINFLHEYAIKTFGSFIVGFPGENEDTINETIQFIEKSKIDYYSLKEFYYLHSTSIASSSEKYELTGQGNKWQHSTMSSTEVAETKVTTVRAQAAKEGFTLQADLEENH